MSRGQVFEQLVPTAKPKRNGFDLSFANNISLKFGQLTPVFCKEVIPGDTFHIQSTFGLKLMPMYFPVQNRMRARLHFFYVRNRNIWTNWKKFYRGDKGVVMPYISGSEPHMFDFFKQGTLADYLGVPTNNVDIFTQSNSLGLQKDILGQGFTKLPNLNNDDYIPVYRGKEYFESKYGFARDFRRFCSSSEANIVPNIIGLGFITGFINNVFTAKSKIQIKFSNTVSPTPPSSAVFSICMLKKKTTISPDDLTAEQLVSGKGFYEIVGTLFDGTKHYFSLNEANSQFETLTLGNYSWDMTPNTEITNPITLSYDKFNKAIKRYPNTYCLGIVIHDLGSLKAVEDYIGFSDVVITNQPVVNRDTGTLNVFQKGTQKINALPFRAYESIYNAIYRNTVNDPFILNGVPEYDQFNTTLGDGADTTDYQLYQDYWEKDFLTTCLPSPQAGTAPLLGFSAVNTPPSSASNTYQMKYTTENGSTKSIRVTQQSSGALSFSASGTSDNALQGDLQALNSLTQFGISINDLRNVNALQRFAEKQIANGYRYKDIIESHFGIEIALRELDMPEFIGGVTQDVNVQAVTQTSEDGNTPLGWQSGNAGAYGQTKKISKYCDEHGFIIGILSVVPIPTYTQLLPKFFTKFGQLDYYSPEFAHIGLQPVTYREVCPIQASASNIPLSNVFGYNRGFYDLLSSVDEAHAEFRGSLRDFLMNRLFGNAPQLSGEFLKIDPEQTNNVFNVTMANDDKIYGQVYFDILAERPLPLYNEPRLE